MVSKHVKTLQEVLLYKHYTILLSSEPSRLLTLEPILLKEEVKNLKKKH